MDSLKKMVRLHGPLFFLVIVLFAADVPIQCALNSIAFPHLYWVALIIVAVLIAAGIGAVVEVSAFALLFDPYRLLRTFRLCLTCAGLAGIFAAVSGTVLLFSRTASGNIVDFLVMDREFPRAIHYCVHGVDESLRAITGTPMGCFHYPSEQLMGILRAELDCTSVDDMIRDGLHEYLDGLQAKMNAIGDSLHNDFFAGRPLAQTQNQAQTSSAGGST